MLSLQPDLVIAWRSGNSVADIDSLEALGIPVFALEATRLSAVPGQIRRLGLLLQAQARAETDAVNFERELERIRQHYGKKRAVTVFYQIWADPLMTLSGQHIISDAIRLCGGINPVSDRHTLAPAVSIESVLAMDPQLIIVAGKADTDSMAFWRRWSSLQAVQAGNIFRYTDDALSRPTSRMLPAVRKLCRTIESGRQHIERTGRHTGGDKRGGMKTMDGVNPAGSSNAVIPAWKNRPEGGLRYGRDP